MSLNISLIKQVISQLELGTSQRATASSLSISKSVVGKLALRIQNSKLSYQQLPTLAADSGFFHLEARIHRAFQNFKIYVGVATTFVSGKCSFLLKAEGASTRLRVSKLNTADIRSNKPAS